MFCRMKLRDHLIAVDGKADKNGKECRRIAKAIRSTPYYVYMIALEHKSAGHVLALGIEKATNGVVTRFDLRPDIWSDQVKAA